ncbi:hypothetical protein SB751_32875, partial [Cupriavidus sp. SIMBA_020]|uniref:hypothetical protein n=1 Tax=Cupriavidus sp. SIMBA_020 TaxID=3085766 RepID=UPI003979DDC7
MKAPLPGVFHPVFALFFSIRAQRGGPVINGRPGGTARQHPWLRDLARFRHASVASQAWEGVMAKVPTVKLNDGGKI